MALRPAEFPAFYDQHAQGLLVFFVRRTFDVEVARDLTAETFAQAFESRERFRGHSEDEAAGWLHGIARHQLSRYVRRGVAERKAVLRLGIQVPAIAPDDYARIVELAELPRLRERVRDALADLSTGQRQALQLRVVEEKPYAEVAARLSVSEPTARARVSRALRQLARVLETPESLEAKT